MLKHFLVILTIGSLMTACEKNSDTTEQAEIKPKMEAQSLTPEQQFLVDNRDKPNVVETESGLQYKVLKPGEGLKPAATDQVTVHYRGTLIDGTEFDSSYSRGEPITFGLNRVIRGWTEGLQLMAIGSKYEFYIPSDLAYGNRGAGAQIGPGATLIFQVELLDIK